MDWVEITVSTTTAGAEAVSEILHELGCGGTLILDRHDIAMLGRHKQDWDYIDESLLKVDDEEVRVTGYLPDDDAVGDALAGIREELARFASMDLAFDTGSCAMTVQGARDEDWAMNWRKYYQPFPVGERLFVQPVWVEEPAPGGRLTVRIDPGMAFGTGTHETTFLCLELLESAVEPGMRMADVGCGTGILGIAALQLGAGSVLAVDRDPVSVTAAGTNKGYNPHAGRLTVRQGDLLCGIDETYDIIAANIIADVIIAFAGDALGHLRPGGVFVASGIILERAGDVKQALLSAGFIVEAVREKGEWAAMLARRP